MQFCTQISSIFTKVVFKPLLTNLFNTVLSAIFLTIDIDKYDFRNASIHFGLGNQQAFNVRNISKIAAVQFTENDLLSQGFVERNFYAVAKGYKKSRFISF